MSRASALAQRLRELKVERDEIVERKASYDHDANRAVVALARFHKIVEKENWLYVKLKEDFETEN